MAEGRGGRERVGAAQARPDTRRRAPYHLGIDLGTTFTAGAVARHDRAEVATLGVRTAAVPTVVHLLADGTFLVGEAAENRAVAEPDRVAREFKRRLGDPTPLLLGGEPVEPTRLYAEVLRWVVDQVRATEGQPPELVAVTHPAGWGRHRLRLLAEAIELSGLSLDSLILPEPVAAATYYASARPLGPEDLLVVYDLGGGTFDVAVVRELDGGFELAGPPEGLERLGGIDIDAAVLAHVDEALGGVLADLDLSDPGTLADASRLRRDCTFAKEALSGDSETAVRAHVGGRSEVVRLTRAELEERIRPMIGETLTATQDALDSAGVDVADVAAFLLVGGSSRIPLVAELVGRHFGRPVAVDAHPKHAVALGAALHAALPSADEASPRPGGRAGSDAERPAPPPPSRRETGRGAAPPPEAAAVATAGLDAATVDAAALLDDAARLDDAPLEATALLDDAARPDDGDRPGPTPLEATALLDDAARPDAALPQPSSASLAAPPVPAPEAAAPRAPAPPPPVVPRSPGERPPAPAAPGPTAPATLAPPPGLRVSGGTAPGAVRPGPPSEPATTAPRGRRWRLAVGAAVAVVVLLGGAVAAWALTRPDDGGGDGTTTATEVVRPEIIDPAAGATVPVGTPVPIRFSGTAPESIEVRLYVNDALVETAPEDGTFLHVFSEPGEQAVVVRFYDPDTTNVRDSQTLYLTAA